MSRTKPLALSVLAAAIGRVFARPGASPALAPVSNTRRLAPKIEGPGRRAAWSGELRTRRKNPPPPIVETHFGSDLPARPKPQAASQVRAAELRQARRLSRLTSLHERAAELAAHHAADEPPLALRPKGPSTLVVLYSAQQLHAAETAPADGKPGKDLAWKLWTSYCRSMGTSPVRSGILPNSGLDFAGSHRETAPLSGFLMHFAETMPGRGVVDTPKRSPSTR